MPEMDGYEVCSRLKSDPGTCDIPIIFLTGKTDAEDETRGFELGAIDYIHKPFSPLVVQARVRTHLALREAREQLAEEKRKVDRLLDNILPPPAVAEIKLTGGVIPRRFENVAVLFSDLVGFTNYCDQHAAGRGGQGTGRSIRHIRKLRAPAWSGKNQNYGRCISRDSRVAGAGRRRSARRSELRTGDFRRGGPQRPRLASEIRRSHRTCHGRDRRRGAISVRCVGGHSECRLASDRSRFSRRRCSYGANVRVAFAALQSHPVEQLS